MKNNNSTSCMAGEIDGEVVAGIAMWATIIGGLGFIAVELGRSDAKAMQEYTKNLSPIYVPKTAERLGFGAHSTFGNDTDQNVGEAFRFREEDTEDAARVACGSTLKLIARKQSGNSIIMCQQPDYSLRQDVIVSKSR